MKQEQRKQSKNGENQRDSLINLSRGELMDLVSIVLNCVDSGVISPTEAEGKILLLLKKLGVE